MILLHREDMYKRESPRAGEADLIVAKHRNGPTAHRDRGIAGPLQPLRRHGARVTRDLVGSHAAWRNLTIDGERVADPTDQMRFCRTGS